MSSRSSVIGRSSTGKRTTEPATFTAPTTGRYLISGTVHVHHTPMVERRREPDRIWWCFRCRAHLPHDRVLMAEATPGYYDPHWRLACSGCGEDHADFPGTYRDGPRWSTEC